MFDHNVCKNCGQRQRGPEFTAKCPAQPMWGHDWEIRSGNGVKWHESYVGKLWKSTIGKVLILGFVAYALLQAVL